MEEDNINDVSSENDYKINYKIEAGKEYIINRQDYNGQTFYSINITKTNFDNTIVNGRKIVRFKNDVSLDDKTKIKIISGFEDFYFKKNDRFTPICTIFITEFEIVSYPEKIITEAYETFNSDSTFDLPF